MELNQLKTLKIDWLGNCPTCGREEHTVSTSEGNKDYLYEDDAVKCWCGQTGVIEVGDGHAWCNWGKKEVSEWDKFNAYYREKYPEYWDLLPKANHQACTHHEELFNTWLAAKSQVVPEGFVLVPKEPSADLVNHGHQVFLGHFNEGGQTGGRSLYFAYKAMIEAQEQSHE